MRQPTISFVKKLVAQIKEDDVPALGAQMTFFFILALFPFLIFILTILSFTPLSHEA